MAGDATVEASRIRAQRVEYIRAKRAAGEWRHHRDTTALAAEWGVHRDTVAVYASDAGRLLAAEIGDVSEVRALCVARLTGIIEDGEPRDAIKAARELATLTAAATPVVDLRTQLLGMSVPERRAWLERQAATIAAILAELPQ